MIHLFLIVALILSGLTVVMPNNRKKPMFFSFVLLFVVAALRDEYGNDFEPYKIIFENAQLDINSANVEVGYFELNKLFPSYHLLLATLSLLYLFVAYKLIVENVDRKYHFFSVFILLFNPYLFLLSFSSLRQTLVLCIFIIALNIKSKRKSIEVLSYLLIILASALIHQTAILLLPMYFYFNLARTKRVERIERIVFIVLPIVLLAASSLLNNLINYVLGYFGNNLNYLSYIENNTPNSLRSTLLTAVFYVYVVFNLNKVEGKAYQYSRMYLCGLFFAILSYRYNMFGRFQMYFDIFGIVSLPMILNGCKTKMQGTGIAKLMNRYLFPAVIVAIFILRYYSFFTTPLWEYFFEYKTFLFK